MTIDGVRYEIVERKDVAAAEGIDHVRHGLLDDGNFVWDRHFADKPRWQFGLEFSDGPPERPQRLIVVFSIDDQRIRRSDSGATLAISPIATGWQEFFADQFPPPAAKSGEHSAAAPR